MSTLNTANLNVSDSLVTSTLSANGLPVTFNTITVGNVVINSNDVTIGNSVINSSTIAVSSLVVGGLTYGGQTIYGAIVNTQIFTANGTWTNPNANATLGLTGNEQVLVMMWGGGGGAASNGTLRVGYGGGGACLVATLPLSSLTGTCSVTVGPGGAGRSGTVGVASDGGNSVFVANSTSNLVAYGGGRGRTSESNPSVTGGGGGGLFGVGSVLLGGPPLGANVDSTVTESTFGGGSGANNLQNGTSSIFGGAGATAEVNGIRSNAGSSIYGGGSGVGAIVGTSPIAGNTGSGGNGSNGTGNPGNRGEVRVWVIK